VWAGAGWLRHHKHAAVQFLDSYLKEEVGFFFFYANFVLRIVGMDILIFPSFKFSNLEVLSMIMFQSANYLVTPQTASLDLYYRTSSSWVQPGATTSHHLSVL